MAFLNIFSKKKEKPQVKQKIIVDNREKNSLVPSELVSLGLEIEWQQLPVADYIVNNTAIERKSASDLKMSIINKRIFSQLKELKQYPEHLLIVEGPSLNSEIIHDNAVRGFFLSTVLEKKVPILFTENEKETAKIISVLANKKPNSNFSMKPIKTILSDKERLIYILEGFPNIGPKTAEKLLDRFKTIRNVFNANEDDLRDCIGSKADKIIELLSKPST